MSCDVVEIIRESFKDLDGYIVSNKNRYNTHDYSYEYNKVEYITGFTGSYGLVIITQNIVVLITDGRYLSQAMVQCPTAIRVDVAHLDAIYQHIPKASKIGYDPDFFVIKELERLHFEFVPIKPNLVDRTAAKQSSYSLSHIKPYPQKYIGMPTRAKMMQFAQSISGNALITDVYYISWLLDVRGKNSCEMNIFAYLLYRECKFYLFTESLSYNVEYFTDLDVTVVHMSKLQEYISATNGAMLIDHNTCPIAISNLADTQHRNEYKIQQIYKTPQEMSHARNINIIDSIALCEFFAWLDTQKYTHKEYDLVLILRDFRSRSSLYLHESFDAICAYDANSAIIHYRPSQDSHVQNPQLLLVDSGGHYYGGTTDVTRVVWVNKESQPTTRHRDIYTTVLKAHIAINSAQVKNGTTFGELDIIARYHLWQRGRDYAHSTGHGVSSCINVHQGPVGIYKGCNIKIEPGIIISNEPGCYIDGEFGVRIENLISPVSNQFIGFDSLTLVPYAKDLIHFDQLSTLELRWLNHYYLMINKFIRPKLTRGAQEWVDKHCACN